MGTGRASRHVFVVWVGPPLQCGSEHLPDVRQVTTATKGGLADILYVCQNPVSLGTGVCGVVNEQVAGSSSKLAVGAGGC